VPIRQSSFQAALMGLLIDQPLNASYHKRISDWFGPHSFEGPNPKKTSYPIQGGIESWLLAHNPSRDYTYFAAEFGTYSMINMLVALRAKNHAHHCNRPEDIATKQAKQKLLEFFALDQMLGDRRFWNGVFVLSNNPSRESLIKHYYYKGQPIRGIISAEIRIDPTPCHLVARFSVCGNFSSYFIDGGIDKVYFPYVE